LDTTEIRWFFQGPLPTEVRHWFIGATGLVEERRDTYLLAGRSDEGVKYRGGRLLELKVRLRVGPLLDVGDGLSGRPEWWRKWAPADALVERSPAQRWVDVDKVIIKRRFSLAAEEVTLDPWDDESAVCEVEVAEVGLGPTSAWTLALAATGPGATRRASLVAGWKGLKAATHGPIPLGLETGAAMSYPEWLDRTVEDASGIHRDGRAMRSACES
jgi:hypothetical protein